MSAVVHQSCAILSNDASGFCQLFQERISKMKHQSICKQCDSEDLCKECKSKFFHLLKRFKSVSKKLDCPGKENIISMLEETFQNNLSIKSRPRRVHFNDTVTYYN
eukprot:TRINITY_DN1567_c0_g1_i1.p1 TRINITY_DN1567_c0_g1~~TRINITY_DN1567_c0_g1_i1.p1  ORF type:complete len:106 (-),score=10.18 TRINITY_DN1567_c0_g1_i1:105-422(-)